MKKITEPHKLCEKHKQLYKHWFASEKLITVVPEDQCDSAEHDLPSSVH